MHNQDDENYFIQLEQEKKSILKNCLYINLTDNQQAKVHQLNEQLSKLSWRLFEEENIKKNYERATHFFIKALSLSNLRAMILYFNQTNCISTELDNSNDFDKDGAKNFSMGLRYYLGLGLLQNQKEAARWYIKAAEQGHAPAQNVLGHCYSQGKGVPKNQEEALKWYRKSAEQGDAAAQHNLGLAYSKDISVPQNQVEAVIWFRKAAEQGYVDAHINLEIAELSLAKYMLAFIKKNADDIFKWALTDAISQNYFFEHDLVCLLNQIKDQASLQAICTALRNAMTSNETTLNACTTSVSNIFLYKMLLAIDKHEFSIEHQQQKEQLNEAIMSFFSFAETKADEIKPLLNILCHMNDEANEKKRLSYLQILLHRVKCLGVSMEDPCLNKLVAGKLIYELYEGKQEVSVNANINIQQLMVLVAALDTSPSMSADIIKASNCVESTILPKMVSELKTCLLSSFECDEKNPNYFSFIVEAISTAEAENQAQGLTTSTCEELLISIRKQTKMFTEMEKIPRFNYSR